MIPSIERIEDNIKALGHLDTAKWLTGDNGQVEVVRVYDYMLLCTDRYGGLTMEYITRFPAEINSIAIDVLCILEEKDA